MIPSFYTPKINNYNIIANKLQHMRSKSKKVKKKYINKIKSIQINKFEKMT